MASPIPAMQKEARGDRYTAHRGPLPDKQEKATQTVLEQAQALCKDSAARRY
jgi:hypothetical protein